MTYAGGYRMRIRAALNRFSHKQVLLPEPAKKQRKRPDRQLHFPFDTSSKMEDNNHVMRTKQNLERDRNRSPERTNSHDTVKPIRR